MSQIVDRLANRRSLRCVGGGLHQVGTGEGEEANKGKRKRESAQTHEPVAEEPKRWVIIGIVRKVLVLFIIFDILTEPGSRLSESLLKELE